MRGWDEDSHSDLRYDCLVLLSGSDLRAEGSSIVIAPTNDKDWNDSLGNSFSRTARHIEACSRAAQINMLEPPSQRVLDFTLGQCKYTQPTRKCCTLVGMDNGTPFLLYDILFATSY